MAFHLISEHPGTLTQSDRNSGLLADALLDPQSQCLDEQFLSILGSRAADMELKMNDIADVCHKATVVDTAGLQLSGDELNRWRRMVVDAPTATEMKFRRGNIISSDRHVVSRHQLIERLTSAMYYDKHGQLDLILYEDGHEEIRKAARKSIWTMREDELAELVRLWLPVLEGHSFHISDVPPPEALRKQAEQAALIIHQCFPHIDFTREAVSQDERRLISAHQLIIDLGEAITRCSRSETFVSTTLFLFLILEKTAPALDVKSGLLMKTIREIFLKAYITSVLVVEAQRVPGGSI